MDKNDVTNFDIGDTYCLDPRTGSFILKSEYDKIYKEEVIGTYTVTQVNVVDGVVTLEREQK
jgi:hypothetical protein